MLAKIANAFWLAGVLALDAGSACAQSQPPKTSLAGAFEVSLEPRIDPLIINQIHSWVVTLADRQGRRLTAAEITIDGGVPDVERKLPTAPRVTQALGEGRFLVEGMKFDMAGRWRLTLDIVADGVKDRVEFDILAR